MSNDAGAATRLRALLGDVGDHRADVVGREAQTAHYLWTVDDDDVADEMWQIAREAARRVAPRLTRLRFVTITTDAPGSFAAWICSLRNALDDAGWTPGRGPEVEVLRIANDVDPAIDTEHAAVSASGIAIRVVPVERDRRPLSLAEARPFAFRCLRDLAWIPTPREPVWSLDEDFRFETLAPSPKDMFLRRSAGPVLHKLDAMIGPLADRGIEIIVGGNTGAAPVPVLGLVLAQLRDLEVAGRVADAETQSSRLALARYAALPDAYYDLAEVSDWTLRLPLWRGWWRADAEIEWKDILARLRAGLPVTRPVVAAPLGSSADAWGYQERVAVAGGNTVLLSPRALRAHFRHVQCGDLVSRRADTTWCQDAQARDIKVVRTHLPLFHDRQMGPKAPLVAARDALADALGVGLSRAMLLGVPTDEQAVRSIAQARLDALGRCLAEAERSAQACAARGCPVGTLVEWLGAARRALVLPTAKLVFDERAS